MSRKKQQLGTSLAFAGVACLILGAEKIRGAGHRGLGAPKEASLHQAATAAACGKKAMACSSFWVSSGLKRDMQAHRPGRGVVPRKLTGRCGKIKISPCWKDGH